MPSEARRRRWLPGLHAASNCWRPGGRCPGAQTAEVIARLAPVPGAATHKIEKPPPAVIWLNPAASGRRVTRNSGNFTLLQKNKMFTPHLLVVPVGSSVAFPNADPFFHNVFRFSMDGASISDLYEAGSTRSVVFSREGVSYIFCNIHSEMSAVVIALRRRIMACRPAGCVSREGRSERRLRPARVDRRPEAEFAGSAHAPSPCCRRGHGPWRNQRTAGRNSNGT
jgi:plastocyanin